jgi:hypothetical protein
VQHPTPVSATPKFDSLGGVPARIYYPLNSMSQKQTPAATYSAGVLATTNMLSLVQPVPGSLDTGGFLTLWGPTSAPTAPWVFANPFDGTAAPKLAPAVMLVFTSLRLYGTTALTSGFELVGLIGSGAPELQFSVGIVTDASLNDLALTNSVDDGIQIALGTGSSVPLVFQTDAPVDDCVVTLYEVQSNVLVPKQRYLVTTPPTQQSPLAVDASLFTKLIGHYTFGIGCRVGTRSMSDYTKISLPFSESMVYTAVFTVSS